ncbi:metalloregulator ArsR/SmtB family transcription factor [Pelagicoccus sp. SDUM812005]|uniref:ArsR/SmtB family transcription factor n=1 Tax=Pelagicoccus sp. SDUM812005 TaxID=3041257 RepID=UPI00280CB9CE|nr:metalloregulator ArsR/SmtB family transcription factor [Pelagicoccus sp. SDUM812005]MDQ8181358.1 metalloregulator ArsR/SmtB family transcription factor [Pelagicoccus sp. SDUM812005]
MVNEDVLDAVFHALADATRRGILRMVAEGSPSVGELGEPFAMSAPAISKHLKVLERAGLLTRVKEGKVNRFRLNPELLEEAGVFVAELSGLWQRRAEAERGSAASEEARGGSGLEPESAGRKPTESDEVLEDYLL